MASPTEIFEVEQLLTAFAYFADHADGDAMGELFLEDATLSIGELTLKGPRAIADDCRRRFVDPHRKTRHVWSNLRVERADADVIATSALQLTFAASSPESPVKLRVNDLHDEFRKDAKGRWRFAGRRIEHTMALTLSSALS